MLNSKQIELALNLTKSYETGKETSEREYSRSEEPKTPSIRGANIAIALRISQLFAEGKKRAEEK